MAKGATQDALGALHTALATVLADALAQQYQDEDGKTVPPPAAILNVARQFLKDNGIEAQAVAGSPLSILSNLPFDGQHPHGEEATGPRNADSPFH